MDPARLAAMWRARQGGARVVRALALLAVLSVAAQAEEPARPVAYTVPDLEAMERAFQSVIDEVAPSVVGLRARRPRALPAGFIVPESDAAAYEFVTVNGSGSIINSAGLILTNEHVVGGATEIDVMFHDGRRQAGTVVAADARSDLAIVQVARTGLRTVRWGDYSRVARGQWTLVVGNPFGLGQDGQLSVSVGVVANLGRQLPGLGEADDRFYYDMIQTTAPINPGDSGGPLFNVHGELIGIVTAMHTRAPADEGIGFAIPASAAKRRLVDCLSKGGAIEYGYLGLTVRLPEPEERDRLGLTAGGILVQQVEPDGPAAAAGLKIGDVIRRFEDHTVTRPAQLAELVGQTPVGTKVRLELLRGGRPQPTDVTVSRRELSRVNGLRGTGLIRQARASNLAEDDGVAPPARDRVPARETEARILPI